jgi:hypothetical protein
MICSYIQELLLVALVIAQDNERMIVSSEDLKMAYKRFHRTYPNFYGAEESYVLEEEQLKEKQSDSSSKVEIPQDAPKECEMSEAINDLSISDHENFGTFSHLLHGLIQFFDSF